MEDIDHVFTEEDYKTLTNYKAFSQFVRYERISHITNMRTIIERFYSKVTIKTRLTVLNFLWNVAVFIINDLAVHIIFIKVHVPSQSLNNLDIFSDDVCDGGTISCHSREIATIAKKKKIPLNQNQGLPFFLIREAVSIGYAEESMSSVFHADLNCCFLI